MVFLLLEALWVGGQPCSNFLASTVRYIFPHEAILGSLGMIDAG